MATCDVVVIGAGIVGTACAAECARAGFAVVLLDRGVIGGGATAAGMGHIVVMDDSEAQFQLTRFSQQLWHELADQVPDSVEYDRCGTIWIAADDEEMAEAQKKKDYYTERGVAAEWLDAHSLADAEPSLRSGLAGGLLVPGDVVVYPPCAAQFLALHAARCGAVVRTGVEVRSIGEGAVQLHDGEQITARRIVMATGQWSPSLLPDLPVAPRKGHLVITERCPGLVHHQLVELGYLVSAHTQTSDSVAFNVQPRRSGQILVGSSRQFDQPEAGIDAGMVARMISRAQAYMPGLADLDALRVWAGHRAAVPDHLPLIGPAPGRDDLILATGHEGLGITTSLATGRLVCDLLTGQPSEIAVEPYSPRRFEAASS